MSFSPAPRKKIALDNSKLGLSAPSTAAGKTANLKWSLVNNNPRIIVWTSDPNDMTEKNNNGKIQAELDSPAMASMFGKLRELIDEPAGSRYKLENKNFTFFGGKRSDEPVVVSEIWVGKDAEGFIFISVTAPTRPVIKFRIMPTSFHTWYTQSGEKVAPEALNKFYVKGYIQIMEDIYNNLAIAEFVDIQALKAAKDAARGGGQQRQGGYGGGGQQRQGGYGGGQPAGGGFDTNTDNIPF